MTITVQLDKSIEAFVAHQAQEQQISPEAALAELVQMGFEAKLRELHSRYIRGEYSFGRLAKELGSTTWELTHLLEERGLQVHNLPLAA
ncbi:MAG: hypothetical protein AAB217_18775 [Chloroflexota bacterium]